MSELFDIQRNSTILEICNIIVTRLSDAEFVHKVVFADENISVFGDHPWGDLVLSNGNLSICLLMAQWDKIFPGKGFDVIAHNYFLKLQKALLENGTPDNISMFSGLSGMAFVLDYASHSGTRYVEFRNNLQKRIFDLFDILSEEIASNNKTGVSPMEYDVISGLSGVGRYLLCISDNPEALKRLKVILKYCISLIQPICINGEHVPGWYIAPENLFTNADREKYPQGSFNCGLAHGIAGPLALLSLASQQGIYIPNQKEAIHLIADWLASKKVDTKKGVIWPSWISLEEELRYVNNVDAEEVQYRDAWCYGTAGVCRSLYLAGKATNCKKYIDIAKNGFVSILHRNTNEWNLDGATFCHGYSGLLQITNRMYIDSGDSVYAELMYKIIDEILKLANEQDPFVYKDFEGENHLNKAGLIDGGSGIALSLMSTLETAHDFTWDNCFLIS